MSAARRALSVAVASATVMVVAGCAGSTGGSQAAQAGDSAGFAYGASQAEVDEAIGDLDPVTLTYQASAASAEAVSAANNLAFKEAVEERSGGKITLDIAWGLSIAGNTELEDALADSRLDLAYASPIYEPDKHPVTDAFSRLTPYGDPSPLVGEMATSAAMTELAWGSDELLSEYTDQGLTPLSPLVNIGDFYILCKDPVESSSDWKGKQLRISGTAHSELADAIGASGVSIEFPETYEALQRGTVDCTFAQAQTAAGSGFIDVAPYVYHLPDSRMSGTTNGAHIAGSSFKQLPAAYQQILFDADVDYFHGTMTAIGNATAQTAARAVENGGSVEEFDPETAATIADSHDSMVDDFVADGSLPEDAVDIVRASSEKWADVSREVGFEDGGSLEKADEWYEEDTLDFRPFTDRVVEDVVLPHRPE